MAFLSENPCPRCRPLNEMPVGASGSQPIETAEAALARMEALMELLRRYRHETPLGHQPHMIAHQVDQLLAECEREQT